jgi:hypothetical protein
MSRAVDGIDARSTKVAEAALQRANSRSASGSSATAKAELALFNQRFFLRILKREAHFSSFSTPRPT